MAGRVDHLILTVNKYAQACRFYGWLMPQLGYTDLHD
jgi:hypothetical protein